MTRGNSETFRKHRLKRTLLRKRTFKLIAFQGLGWIPCNPKPRTLENIHPQVPNLEAIAWKNQWLFKEVWKSKLMGRWWNNLTRFCQSKWLCLYFCSRSPSVPVVLSHRFRPCSGFLPHIQRGSFNLLLLSVGTPLKQRLPHLWLKYNICSKLLPTLAVSSFLLAFVISSRIPSKCQGNQQWQVICSSICISSVIWGVEICVVWLVNEPIFQLLLAQLV